MSQTPVPAVVNPQLRTDRSVDTRSARTIVRDLVRPGMSNEERALALFHWVRRVIFHSGPDEPLRHDFNRMINVFGYGSCYMQTHPLSHLYHQLGWPCRNWLHDGHHMLEVFFDGAWHCLDPHMTFYVYNRAEPPAIAGVAELREDPTLAGEAMREGRAGPAFLICGDAPTWFSGDSGWVLEGEFPPHVGADEEFGGIALRRGERFVRTWSPGTYYLPHAFPNNCGPYHTCGPDSDRRDPVNFPYWEPYPWSEGRTASHRHYGTGYLEYAPDLRGDGWRDGTLRHINLVGDPDPARPALHPATGGLEAEAVFRIACPYILTRGALELEGRLREAGDRITVSVSKEWVGDGQRRDWETVLEQEASGSFRDDWDLTPLITGSLRGYWLRVTIQARHAEATGLDRLALRTEFQLNPYALPQLVPGANLLFVTAARAEAPWGLRLAWSEGPSRQSRREYRAQIDGATHEATVDVAGPGLPRMEALEFSVAP